MPTEAEKFLGVTPEDQVSPADRKEKREALRDRLVVGTVLPLLVQLFVFMGMGGLKDDWLGLRLLLGLVLFAPTAIINCLVMAFLSRAQLWTCFFCGLGIAIVVPGIVFLIFH